MTENAPARPLDHVRILDLAVGPVGAVGRTLAELGADVIRIEPRAGGMDRNIGPCAAGIGLAFAAANLGKRGIALDLGTAEDHAIFEQLVSNADIVIETTRPGSVEASALDIPRLRARNPGLVILSLSDFGPGALEQWVATDGVLQALSGELSRSGRPGRPPLLPPGELAIQCAAAQAVYTLLVAYLARCQTGVGDHLDMSLLDGATQALDPGFGMGGSATSGVPASKLPRGRPDASFMYPVLPVRDGFIRLCILAPRQWQGMFEWMGRPEAFADPAFNDLNKRFETPALLEAIAEFVANKTQAEVETESQKFRVPAAAVATLDKVLGSAHVAERCAFREVELPKGATAPFPNGAMKIDGVRAAAAPALPDADGSAAALLQQWTSAPVSMPGPDVGQPGKPLAGIRVLDLGVIVVGAEQGRLLADYGAEVIKVESAAFPDGARASSPGGMSPGFASGHRNKRGLGLNLRSEEGRELFLKLVEQSDIILSNFKPGTMESLGLSKEVLSTRNPRVITVESSAYGDSGPWSERMGYGPLVRASAGLTSQWRYADDANSYSETVTIYPDHVAARLSVAAVLALLLRRGRTGKGGSVSLSQMEVMLSQMAPLVAETILAARGVPVEGEPARDTPWDVFPCAGDDEWCVVTVRDNSDWVALCEVLERSDLACDPALADAGGRAAQRARINEAVAGWTAARSPAEAATRLQAGGVPAAPMLRVSELPESDYFQSRPIFDSFVQPGLPGSVTVDNLPVRSERLSRPPLLPAPLMGQDSAAIARELLRFDEKEIERLFAEGVLQGPSQGANR